jgi:hypothetical protein
VRLIPPFTSFSTCAKICSPMTPVRGIVTSPLVVGRYAQSYTPHLGRLRKGFDAAPTTTYAVTRMSSTARTERIFARSTLSGRPVGLPPISLDLLGLLLLAR